ncbi:unnamed protein product, partial [Mesorhabditis belari]|uniref:Uncharacterized protein n=1 Tax=Mesorhabditis belari TaxID=2138241 RepID=A0AAF3JBT2_9BILA
MISSKLILLSVALCLVDCCLPAPAIKTKTKTKTTKKTPSAAVAEGLAILLIKPKTNSFSYPGNVARLRNEERHRIARELGVGSTTEDSTTMDPTKDTTTMDPTKDTTTMNPTKASTTMDPTKDTTTMDPTEESTPGPDPKEETINNIKSAIDSSFLVALEKQKITVPIKNITFSFNRKLPISEGDLCDGTAFYDLTGEYITCKGKPIVARADITIDLKSPVDRLTFEAAFKEALKQLDDLFAITNAATFKFK